MLPFRAAAAAVLLALAPACGDETAHESTTGPPNEGGAGGTGGAPVNPEDYLDRPLREQVDAMETSALSCDGLTQGYLGRIDTRDVEIHSIIARDSAAGDAAVALDAKRGGGALLQGAVMLVKDNIDSIGLPNTAGSLALADNLPAEDAPTVAKMRAANALVLGKTNLSEWANFRGFNSSSGWSSLGGQTNNGKNPAYNPCGSSSGSAAAVAAGLASAALGTETDGSIVCPASINGVVGFKPTVGLVSRTGVIPISSTQDTVGPITKTVGDAARVLRVLAGPDPADPATAAIPPGLDLDFEAALDSATLQGARLGVVTSLTGYSAALDQVFDAELQRLQAAGATLVDVTLPGGYNGDEFTVLVTEFKVGINAYLASHPAAGQATTLAELIAFNDANAAAVMPYFGQEIFEQAEATNGLSDPGYLMAKADAHATIGENGILAVLAANNLDALLAPTTGPAWMTDYANGDAISGGSSGPAAVAGYPHLTVPMGEVSGLPVGLSIFAGPWQDGEVLALGYAYEQLPR